MKYLFSSFILLISISSIVAQELIVDSGVVLKKGVYRTFEEFKNNSPSLEYSGKLSKRTVGYGIVGSGGSVTYYGIEKNADAYYKMSDVFGFCDGENVYFNTNSSIYKLENFVKVDYLGRFCYFEYVENGSTNFNCNNNGGVGVTVTSNTWAEGIININNGKFHTLSATTLEELFLNSETLKEEKNRVYQKGANYKSFVVKYSELNKDEINRNPPLNRKELDASLCRTAADTTLDDYISRILFLRNDTRFNKVKLIDKRYGSGYPKMIGLKASHNLSYSQGYLYQIGTWQQYHKNGKVKEAVCYNLNGDKHGPTVKYNEKGEVVDELLYKNGKLFTK